MGAQPYTFTYGNWTVVGKVAKVQEKIIFRLEHACGETFQSPLVLRELDPIPLGDHFSAQAMAEALSPMLNSVLEDLLKAIFAHLFVHHGEMVKDLANSRHHDSVGQ